MQKKSLLLMMLIMVIPFLIRAEWIPFNKNKSAHSPPNVTLISDDDKSTVLKIEISGFDLTELNSDGKTYQLADLLSESFIANPGFPKLPYIARTLAIPDQGSVSFEVIETGEVHTFDNIYLSPARESWFEGSPEIPYTENGKVYNATNVYPTEHVRIESPSIFRDFRIARVSVFPLRYFPDKKQLQAVSSITVRINYKNGTSTNAKISKQKKIATSFGQLYNNFIFNYQSKLDKKYNGKEEGHELMLCIMPDEFFDSFQSYAEWKRQSGIDIHITKFSDIGANSSDPAIIKNHISDAYFNWDIPPTYVLLVGDDGVVPTGDYYANENYFVELEGNDYFPELLIGRFTNQGDYRLQVMINKFLMYEQNPFTSNTEWFKKGICCSNNAYESQVETKRFAAKKMMEYGFTSVDTMMSSYPCNYDLNDVINAINEGRSHLNYRGEGWSSGWWANCTPLNVSDLPGINNGQKFPFVTSIGCGVGMFDSGSSNCFGEEWVEMGTITSPKGAVAFIGPMGNTHTTYNNKIDKGIYVGMFQEGLDTPGQALLRGRLYMYNVFGDISQVANHYRIYCTLGDPSIHIWKDVPEEITVDHPASVPLGNSTMEVTVTHSSNGEPVTNAVVCITDETFFATGITDELGKAYIEVEAPEPKIFTITVRGGNVIPYQDELIAVQPTGAYVIEDSFIINDATGGNNDGLMDYGETNLLSLTMKNVGVGQAENIQVTLNTNNPYITISDNTADYGNIDPDATSVVTDGFAYSVANDIPDLEIVTFEATASNGLDTWISNFSVEAHAPILEYVDYSLSDPAGNNNGKLDPGETANLTLTIENSGSSDALNVLGELIENDPFVAIDTPELSFGNITGGTQASALCTVSADINTPTGHLAEFSLSVNADLQITTSGEFGIVVGQVPVLIVDLDENGNSAPHMVTALNTMDITYDMLSYFPPDLNLYSTIFVCLGIFADNHHLSSNEGQVLADYLNNGGSLYMEGGDTWCYDQSTQVHGMFNINPEGDGTTDMSTVVGQTGTFTEGMVLNYNGDNSFMDHIGAISPAIQIFKNDAPSYGTGVAYDAGNYKTIASSHEFGGLTDGTSPSTKEELMSAYLDFLGISQTLQASFISNTNETCTEEIIEFYDNSSGPAISWEWEFESGTPATSSEQNPYVVYFNPGTFDVTLTISDNVDTSTLIVEDYITVMSGLESPPAPIGPAMVCKTTENTTYNTSGLTGEAIYEWILEPSEAGNITDTGLYATVSWEDEFLGEATLKVSAVNVCGSGAFSDPIAITRYLPEVTLETFEMVCLNSPTFELTGGLPLGGEYSGPGVENGWFDPNIAGLGTHNITYSYSDPENCDNFTTESILVDPCTGIINNATDSDILIYPNPTSGIINVNFEQDIGKTEIIVVNTLNKVVYSETTKTMLQKTLKIDISNQSRGIYTVIVKTEKKEERLKVILK